MESMLAPSDAKACFSEVVEKVANSEEIVVTRMGRPVVRITRFVAHGQCKLGDFVGRIRLSEDFDEWPPTSTRRLAWLIPQPAHSQVRRCGHHRLIRVWPLRGVIAACNRQTTALTASP